jgi:hypothetical protein
MDGDKRLYKQRHKVENMFAMLIATTPAFWTNP